MRRPYWVCTGLQDNGSWCGPSSTRSGGIHMWNWISVGGGDGFQTQVDPTDPNIFYTESQNGNINRYDLNTGQTQSIRPRAGGGGGGGGAAAAAVAVRGAAARGGGGWQAAVAAAAAAAATSSAGPTTTWPQAVQLELADPALAAQPEHAAVRRHALLHLARSRRHAGR